MHALHVLVPGDGDDGVVGLVLVALALLHDVVQAGRRCSRLQVLLLLRQRRQVCPSRSRSAAALPLQVFYFFSRRTAPFLLQSTARYGRCGLLQRLFFVRQVGEAGRSAPAASFAAHRCSFVLPQTRVRLPVYCTCCQPTPRRRA
jgi:hypothetical protein